MEPKPGAFTIEHLPHALDIPKEFGIMRANPWNAFVEGWFFDGADPKPLVAKAGIDKQAALHHVTQVLASWGLAHEHKMAGAAYLMDLWFEPL